MIKIIIPGDPIAQARMRIYKRGPKVMAYDPQGAIKLGYKNLVRDQVDEAL